MEAALAGVQYLDTTGELKALSTVDPTIYSLCVCRVVWKEITGVGMPRDKPAGEDVNL